MGILKKILKFICTLILILALILIFFAVIKPAYINYKPNKKTVVVDTSGKRATSKNKTQEDSLSSEENKNSKSTNSKKTEYEPVVFDDRILLYVGEMNYDSIKMLADILIEDANSETFSKIDIHFENIKVSSSDISYSDTENYKHVLNEFKDSLSPKDTYLVELNHNKIKTVVNKIIIKKLS